MQEMLESDNSFMSVISHPTTSRNVSLDALRGIAVLLVLMNHQRLLPDTPYLSGGWLGVDLFFCLSGYFIGQILLREYSLSGTISKPAFWARRARRLLPALLVFLSLWTVVVLSGTQAGQAVGNPTVPSASTPEVIAGGWFATLTGVQNWWLHYGLPYPTSFGHLWSLAIEWQFYAVAPFLIYWMFTLPSSKNKRRTLFFTVVTLATVLAVAHIFLTFTNTASLGYISTFGRAPALLAGVAIAIAVSSHLDRQAVFLTQKIRLRIMGMSAVGLLSLWLLSDQRNQTMIAVGLPLAAVLSAALLWVTVSADWNGTVPRLFAWFGQRSYSAYLYNLPIVLIIAAYGAEWNTGMLIGITWILTWLVAAISWRLVEKRTFFPAPAKKSP